METNLFALRAEVAKRAEDSRIARKHFAEAAARVGTPENTRAYNGALSWWDTCKVREEHARSLLIRAQVSA